MREFGIAACQTAWAAGDNLGRMRAEIARVKARFPWVEMVIFGELVACGADSENAVPLPGPIEDAFCHMAREHGVWLLPGSVYESESGRVYNTAHVIDPAGRVVDRYRKIYPFAPYEAGVAGGERFVVFDVPQVGRFGVLICYDGWFPETLRTLTWLGAEVILHPVMTNTIDRDVELAIARASAAQHQCYIINVNSADASHGILGYGRSIVVGPDGDVVHQAGVAHEVIAVRVDLDRVTRSRECGVLGLGQPLKSFRDTPIVFPPYEQGRDRPAHLDALGPLTMPTVART